MTTETKALDDSTLATYYVNARATYQLCGGHKKAARNAELMRKYQEALEARCMPLPGEEIKGVFNGAGSS